MQMKPKLRCANDAVHLPECDDCSALEGRVGALEEDVEVLEGKVAQNETDIDTLDTRVDQNDSDISVLDTRVTALESGGGGGGGSFTVHFTWGDPITSDKTFAEIKAAYDNGESIIGEMDGIIMPLTNISDYNAVFAQTAVYNGSPTVVAYRNYIITNEDVITENIINAPLPTRGGAEVYNMTEDYEGTFYDYEGKVMGQDSTMGGALVNAYYGGRYPIISYMPPTGGRPIFLYPVDSTMDMGGYRMYFQSYPNVAGDVYAFRISSNQSAVQKIRPIGGTVTHVTDNEGTLDMTAQELLNALKNTSVYVVKTQIDDTSTPPITNTIYSPIIGTATDESTWSFFVHDSYTGMNVVYQTDYINGYPQTAK